MIWNALERLPMLDELNAFLSQVPEWKQKTSAELIHYFVYFLTVVKEQPAATPGQIEKCFDMVRLTKYSNVSAYMSKNAKRLKGKRSPFLKLSSGYQLERTHESEIGASLQSGPARTQASNALNDLLTQLTDREEKAFLQEAIDCYSIDARRASIVLVWILTIHHLYQYILKHKKTEFNTELSKIKDKRVKVSAVNTVDDFSDIPEGIFIELARAARIITNDVRKILDVKLGIRNTYAHPSAVMISQVKTTDFILDLIQNVILKYRL